LSKSTLRSADLRGIKLNFAQFIRRNHGQRRHETAEARMANFSDADLSGADFRSGNFSEQIFPMSNSVMPMYAAPYHEPALPS
jgi:uncharacterized protein YjbI with pentapeptide repeats